MANEKKLVLIVGICLVAIWIAGMYLLFTWFRSQATTPPQMSQGTVQNPIPTQPPPDVNYNDEEPLNVPTPFCTQYARSLVLDSVGISG